MRILVAADKDILADYLRNAGHETKSLYVNDMAVEVSRKYGAEVVVYLSTVTEIEPHKNVVKALKDDGYRVVLGAGNNDPLIAYAAALGVTDIILSPLDPADVLYRLNNPATLAEVAALVWRHTSQMNGTTQNTTDALDFRRGQEQKGSGDSGGENEKIEKAVAGAGISEKDSPKKNLSGFIGNMFTKSNRSRDEEKGEAPAGIILEADNAATVEPVTEPTAERLARPINTTTRDTSYVPSGERKQFIPIRKSFSFPGFSQKKVKIDSLLNIAVISPWMPRIGTTSLAILLSEKLKSSIVDTDLTGRGVGVRLGVPPSQIWEYDWRDGGKPLVLDNDRLAWTLDPHVYNDANSLFPNLKEIVREAKTGGSVVIDAGSNPLTWYAEEAIDASDVVCVAVSIDSLSMARSLPRWRREFTLKKPAVAALIDDGDPNVIEEEYGLKCIKINLKNNGGINELVTELHNSANVTNIAPYATVFIAGASNLIQMPGVNCHVFRDTFTLWKSIEDVGMPDALIFYTLPGVERFIKELRNDNPCLPIAVVGSTDDIYYQAGVNACYEELSPGAVRDLIARTAQTKKASEQAAIDELTGCLRKQGLEFCLKVEARRYRETGEPFSVLMCDLDHFKKVNDTYGHQAGDQVLREFGGYLRDGVRNADKVIRYGGEEFVVVFSRCRADDVFKVADKLREGWSEREIQLPSGGKLQSTFSCGVAEYGRNGMDAKELLEAADMALYKAKEGGRNIVLTAS